MSWMQTFTGRAFRLDRIEPGEICLEDIAHGLSQICRFNGHCKVFYSVAQHSVLVSREAELLAEHAKTTAALWGLLHDASEAYMGDLTRPMRMTPVGQPWREIEQELQAAIAARFGLPSCAPPEVKRADEVLLATEKRDLMAASFGWDWLPPPLPAPIEPLKPTAAKDAFLWRYWQLAQRLEREGEAQAQAVGKAEVAR